MNRIVQNFPALSVYEEEHKKGDLIWFLHGSGDTHHTWDELFIDLKNDFRLLSIDLQVMVAHWSISMNNLNTWTTQWAGLEKSQSKFLKTFHFSS